MKFGLAIPTGTEGLMYPIPFALARDNVRLSVRAEELGFDSVWGNDHVSTQHYVRAEFDNPPNYYAPLVVLAHVAARTTRLNLGTALLVVPFRHPVNIAKEVATLDHLSDGRLLLGVGIGAYREEFEQMYGHPRGHNRGAMLDEALESLRLLFSQRSASFEGRYYRFDEVESFPKPVQDPFPLYIGGNSPQGRVRAGRHGLGWLPAILSPEEVGSAVAEIKQVAEQEGRDPSNLDFAPQLAVSLGRDRSDAMSRFQESQVYKHLLSLRKSTLKGQDPQEFPKRNLIGSPDEIVEQIERYRQAGATTLSALLFACNTVDETMDAMEQFAKEVMIHCAA